MQSVDTTIWFVISHHKATNLTVYRARIVIKSFYPNGKFSFCFYTVIGPNYWPYSHTIGRQINLEHYLPVILSKLFNNDENFRMGIIFEFVPFYF